MLWEMVTYIYLIIYREGEKMKRKKTVFSSIGAFLLLLVAKLKFVLVVLKFFKLTTVISLLISLAAYGMVYGWKFGIIVVYLLLVHEMGHVWAMKHLKIPTNPMLFIPFVGGIASGKDRPKNAYDDAFIAYMGPLFGFLSIIPAIPLYALTNNNLWMVVILVGSVQLTLLFPSLNPFVILYYI